MKFLKVVVSLLVSVATLAQKKPLDHSVYDSWQSLGERTISKQGNFVAYSVNVQEGDNQFYLQSNTGKLLVTLPRVYQFQFSANEAFLVGKIRPLFQETRQAKIKKKRPDEMPKDSLVIIELATQKVTKIAKVKSFSLPDEGGNFVAYLLEKNTDVPAPVVLDSAARLAQMNRLADSLLKVADSLRLTAQTIAASGFKAVQKSENKMAKPAAPKEDPIEEGTELVIRNLATQAEIKHKLVQEYGWDKNGNQLFIEFTRKNNVATTVNAIAVWQASTQTVDTILRKFNDAKAFAWSETGKQLAFTVERDSAKKESQKFYQLFLYQGKDTAKMVANRFSKGMPEGFSFNENTVVSFSKKQEKLWAGIGAVLAPKDTTLPDFERVSVDVWNHKDDYLQTTQLYNLNRELRRTFLVGIVNETVVPIESPVYTNARITDDGDGNTFYVVCDTGKRVATQWQGFAVQDVFAVNATTGEKKLVLANFKGSLYPSSTGDFLLGYQEREKRWFSYHARTQQLVTIGKDITTPTYDVENDVPDDANAYGVAKFTKNDEWAIIKDEFDWWLVDPTGKKPSKPISWSQAAGRAAKTSINYVEVNRDVKTIEANLPFTVGFYNDVTKQNSFATAVWDGATAMKVVEAIPVKVAHTSQVIAKAKNASTFVYTQENYQQSPNLFVYNAGNTVQLSNTNTQQANYVWGTAELFTWKAYTGKQTQGILYKPENFDATKKYPMIVYFYERNNQTLHQYRSPAPTASALNIPYFVSNGYIVFVPDIWYTTGKPGQSAFNYIVSGTRALVKLGFVDSTKMALQGQSWGGYQAAQLVTQTPLYAAAWAGAPVANMFSAYGGIRWESGLNRQFQYEKQQSRIGATIWGKPNLYIENSPLFHLPKVKTPVVIMHNDADGAVPWYQGIELFTALRRLQKPVWMLNYNGEAHNLLERKNRKDIQIRQQQFFDWLLKGAKPAPWLEKGVPAIQKGRTLGL
ncbi:MAG: S9 family peptidase [Bacteroidetes bacterium]|nr:MAG: S9 family peptidase [Bacteroidota bacterium]